jgi:uncharacterized damage-inducible protein DinB
MNLPEALTLAVTHQHNMLDELLQAINSERLYREPAPGKWSINDQLAHLAIYQPVFIERIHKILKENSPAFGRYVADTDEQFLTGRKKTSDELMRMLKADREKLIKLLSSLSPEQIQRTGTHPLFGPMTIAQWTEFFVLHEAHHLFSIFRLRNQQNPA